MLIKQYSKTNPNCKVTFTLPVDAINGANQVKLIGEFNEWNPTSAIPMKKLDDQYIITLELPVGRDYQFRYIGDNGLWANDWAADNYIPSPYDHIDNSVLSLEEGAQIAYGSNSPTRANASSDTEVNDSGIIKTLSLKTTTITTKDDLKKIEGIGPKIAEILATAGIGSFERLATAEVTELKAILENAGNRYKMHNPATWSKQAKLAASGDWDRLKKLQDELNGGKLQ